MSFHTTAAAGLAALIASSGAFAVTNPFTEDFTAGPAGWVVNDEITPPTFAGGGGPDGPADSFVSTSHNFVNDTASSTPILFQGNPALGTSGGAFSGDYIAAGVTQISFNFRHFASAPLSIFYRVAPETGAGFIAVDFAPNAFPGQWTNITFDLTPGSSQLIAEGTNYNDIFSDVYHTQIGVAFPSIGGTDADFQFQIDDITLVPTPASALVLLGAPLAMRRRRA